MKKLLFPIACALTVLGTSCEDTPDQPKNSQQIKGSLPTCIIPADETQPVILTETPAYSFTFYTYTGMWTIGVANIKPTGLPELDFTSPEISAAGGYNRNLYYNSPFSSKNGETVTNLQAYLCADYYYYTGESSLGTSPLGTLTTVSFTVPDKYSVRAFPKRAYYGGSTSSSFAGADGSQQHFISETSQFGVEMDLSARTATITIINAHFAEAMPTIPRMVLNDLKLEGDHTHGYVIKGENIVPVVGEGQGAVPYPSFTFDKIEFNPTNTLMYQAECDFEVAGRYKGKFTGSFSK